MTLKRLFANNKIAVSEVDESLTNQRLKTARTLLKASVPVIFGALLSACGSGGSDSQPSVQPTPPAPIEPVEPSAPAYQVVEFDFARQSAGKAFSSSQLQSSAFNNSSGNFLVPIAGQNLTGNLTLSVSVEDADGITGVYVGFNDAALALNLTTCSSNCANTYHKTLTGINPTEFGGISGEQLLQLWVDDAAGNRNLVDSVSYNWQITQVTGVSGNRGNNAIDLGWNNLTNYFRYNVYVSSEPGVTPDNYQSKADGQAFLALTSPSINLTGKEDIKTFYTMVTAVDGSGESAFSEPETFVGLADAVDTPPNAGNDNYTMAEDGTISQNVLDNDSDLESEVITVSTAPLTPVSNGSLTLADDGSFTYKPSKDFFGRDGFIYQITDGVGNTDTGVVTITVNQANDPPEASFNRFNINLAAPKGENAEHLLVDLTVNVPGLLINDLDIDSSQLMVVTEPVQPPTQGTLQLNSDGSFLYVPDDNASGEDSFSYQTIDTTGALSVPTEVFITFNATSESPIAANDRYELLEDEILVVNNSDANHLSVLANDTDADDQNALTMVNPIEREPQNGVLSMADNGTFTYTPNPGFFGVDSFIYRIIDGQGNLAQAAALLIVTRTNTNPSAIPDVYSFDEDTTLTVNAVDGLLSNDRDADFDPLTVNPVVLTAPLNGSVTLAQDGSFSYTPAANFTGLDSFRYELLDDSGGSAAAVVRMNINNVNDPPTAIDDGTATEENTPVTIDVLVNDSDPEGDSLTITEASVSANQGTVEITSSSSLLFTPRSNFVGIAQVSYTVSDNNGGVSSATAFVAVGNANQPPIAVDDSYSVNEDEVLRVTNGSGLPLLTANDSDPDGDNISVFPQPVSDVSNGTLNLGGSGNFTYTPDDNFFGTDTFQYQLRDTSGSTSVATVTITINSVNDIPVAVNDNAITSEETTIRIDALSNDFDADGDFISYVSATSQHGSISLNADNTMDYTPSLNFVGVDVIDYTISDGSTAAVSAIVDVTVINVNDAPVAVDDNSSTTQNNPVTVNVLNNDSDVDGDSLTVISATTDNGSAIVNNGSSITFTPDGGFFGNAVVTYTVSDGNQAQDIGNLFITVTEVNSAPIANNDTVSIDEDNPVNIDVLANDSDPNGDSLTIISANADSGSVSIISGNQINYIPTKNFNGTATIDYTIEDSSGLTAQAQVSVSINAVNDLPIVVNDVLTTTEDTAGVVDVLANDSDVEGALTVSTASAQSGSAAILPDNTISYTPNANFNGIDTLTYTAVDNEGGTASATVTITVVAVNDAPLVTNDTAQTNEEKAVTVEVLSNDSDIDGDTLTVVAATANSGTVAINDGKTLTYTPQANFQGQDVITYTVSDPGGLTASGTVAVEVLEANDNPVAVDDTATTNEDTLVTINVLANDTDIDSPTLTVTQATASNGEVIIKIDGTLDYTPKANFNGSDTIQYSIDDGELGTASAKVTVTVVAVNDAPIAQNDVAETNEDTSVTIEVLANDSDVDDEVLIVNVINSTSGGALPNPDNSITFFPTEQFFGEAVINYSVTDAAGLTANAQVTVTVKSVNDSPIAVNDTAVTAEDTTVSVNVLSNDSDPDGDSLTVTVEAITNGTVTSNSGGTIAFAPTADFSGTATVDYSLSDANGGSASATLTITVVAVNDQPVAQNDTFTIVEDSSNSLTVLANDSDADGDTLTITNAIATSGQVSVDNNTALSYTPSLDFNGSDTIDYTISDGNGGVASATVQITVTALNDAPVAVNDSATVAEDVGSNIDVLANDSDVDTNDTLRIIAASSSNGAVSIVDASTAPKLNFVPTSNFNGQTSISYTIADTDCSSVEACTSNHSATATVAVTVNAVNDTPTLVDTTASVAENAVNGHSVITLQAVDVDDTTFSYSITNGNTDSIFGLNSSSGEITVVDRTFLNFEKTKSYTLSVSVSDPAGLSATAQVVISVTEVLENVTLTLDSAFGNTGVTGLTASNAFALDNIDKPNDAVMDSSGRVIMVGSVNQTNTNVAVTRFLANGQVDVSFGVQGLFTKDLGGFDSAQAVTTDSSNNIYVVGELFTGSVVEIFIAKFLSSGAIDTSFGTSGVASTSFSISNLKVTDVHLHSDSTLGVLAAVNNEFTLYKFNSSTGAQQGSVTVNMTGEFDVPTAIAEQSDGKVVIAGYTADSANSFNYDFAVARVDYTNMTIDTSFATNGITTFDLGKTADDIPSDMLINSSGDIYIAGGIALATDVYDTVVVGLTSGGVLNTGFGTSGISIIDADGDNGANSNSSSAIGIAADSSGQILLGVQLGIAATNKDVGVAKLLSSGSLDTSYGTNGVVSKDLGSGENLAVAMMLDSSAQAVVASSKPGSSNQDFALLRFTSSGSFDSSFGNNGYTTVNHSPGDDTLNDGIELTTSTHSGKFLYTGLARVSSTVSDLIVARYNNNGSLDTSFANSGYFRLSDAVSNIEGRAVAELSDGRTVIAGIHGESAVLVLLDVNGRLDTSFDSDGIKTISAINNNLRLKVNAVAVHNNQIVFAGYAEDITNDNVDLYLGRLTTSGTFDSSFGTSGEVVQSLGAQEGISDMTVLTDGSVIVVGTQFTSNTSADEKALVAKFNSSGTLDTSGFAASSGYRAIDTNTTVSDNQDMLYGVAVASDGTIYATGQSSGSNGNQTIVVSLSSNGDMNTAFSGDGILTSALNSGSAGRSIALDSNGKILVSGIRYNATNGFDDVFVARFDSSGNFDTLFNNGSHVDIDLTGGDSVSVLLVLSDGRVMLGGNNTISGYDTQVWYLQMFKLVQ